MKVPVLPPPDDDDEISVEFVTDEDHKGMADPTENSRDDISPPEPPVRLTGRKAGTLPSSDDDEKEKKLEELLVRRTADYENLRRRVEREKANLKSQAREEIVKELLPFVDNLDRAIESHAEDTSGEWRKGLELLRQQILDILKKFGVSRIESVGDPFDPTIHEAVALSDESDYPPNTVTMEFEKGYLLDGRTLKPAKVVVSPPSGGDNQGGDKVNG